MTLPCLKLNNIRYISKVKWSNPGKGVAPSLTPLCSSYWKGNLLVALDYGRQHYLLLLILFKIYEFNFIWDHVETNASCCLFQAMQQTFSLHRCICKKHQIICIVCICDSFARIFFCFLLFYRETIFFH